MNQHTLSRREFAAALAATSLTACAPTVQSVAMPADAAAALEAIAWRLLETGPEGATSLGVDTGVHAGLRSQLGDRSARGVAELRQQLREGLRIAERLIPGAIDPQVRTSLAVVRSAFSVALDGLALPYGDVAVGGWRNTPYVVIQNVGAYLDTPRFLDSDHPVRDAADAEAYLARLAQFPAQLDGELGAGQRRRAAWVWCRRRSCSTRRSGRWKQR